MLNSSLANIEAALSQGKAQAVCVQDCPTVLPTLASFMEVLSTFAFFPKCLCSFTLILHVLEVLTFYHLNDNAFIMWAYAICVGQLYTPGTEECFLRGKVTLQEEAVVLTLVSEVSVVIWLPGFWACGQTEHHGEERACGRAKLAPVVRGAKGGGRWSLGWIVSLMLMSSRTCLPYLDLPPEVSTASQPLSRLLIYKYLNLSVRSMPSWSSHLPDSPLSETLLHWDCF